MILDARQKRAEELRRLTDKSASMSEEQLNELRADIKVSAQPAHVDVLFQNFKIWLSQFWNKALSGKLVTINNLQLKTDSFSCVL